MKVDAFILDNIVFDDTEIINNIEYYGDTLPFALDDFEDEKSLKEKINTWRDLHGFDVVKRSLIDFDCEDAVAFYSAVFKYDNKYYRIQYEIDSEGLVPLKKANFEASEVYPKLVSSYIYINSSNNV